MIAYFEQLVKSLEGNLTKKYLILANIVLVCFAIWFANAGLLPFKNAGDFAFFAALTLILGLYRPGWTFLFFVGTLALENINLAPKAFGISLRPYQFFGFITLVALAVQYFSKRLIFSLPKFKWVDGLVVAFVVGGFLSSLGAVNVGASFKQSIIALSFAALYFLTRVYVQSLDDLTRLVPFFLNTAIVVAVYSIWQNVSFLAGKNSFEVMPGRPNGTFTEADWLGIYFVFVLAALCTLIYQKQKNKLEDVFYWLLMTLALVVLILTVSRSAWIGAAIVFLGYLKLSLIFNDKNQSLSQGKKLGFWQGIKNLVLRKWHWKEFFCETGKVIGVIALSSLIIYVFGLTRFQLASRAQSTGGEQKITVACEAGKAAPERIATVEELAAYGCRHINLEEIEKEKIAGNSIQEIFRPDPNVGIRAKIYKISWEQIKENPILGIGWGSISTILGNDERGAGLNASNMFLETWLGAGLLGFLSLLLLFGYILVASVVKFVKAKGTAGLVFVSLGLFAIIVPNLFNSGIFLGFVWVYLAVAIGLLEEKR